LIIFISIFFNACNVVKLTTEFNHAKSNDDIVLVYNEIRLVEKNKAINVLVSKYLDSAPDNEP